MNAVWGKKLILSHFAAGKKKMYLLDLYMQYKIVWRKNDLLLSVQIVEFV